MAIVQFGYVFKRNHFLEDGVIEGYELEITAVHDFPEKPPEIE